MCRTRGGVSDNLSRPGTENENRTINDGRVVTNAETSNLAFSAILFQMSLFLNMFKRVNEYCTRTVRVTECDCMRYLILNDTSRIHPATQT